MSIQIVFLYYLSIINCVAFVLYGIDKYKATKNKWRIPENTLILAAVIGGSVGALLGMNFFHHKTLHKKFTIGVPFILLLQIGLAAYFFFKA